ncbi:MAG: HAMP domain-containing sensor histidine kinase [Verrucomicrobiota bacterium]
METTTAIENPKFTFSDEHLTLNSANQEFYNQLLRGMTHKLNNLLAVIQGFSSLILMNDDLDETVTENLNHMKEAAQNASGLSERILPAGGCANSELQDLKLTEFVPMIENTLREPAEKNGVAFNMNLPSEMPTATADPGRLKEILIELLTNAAEAAKEGGGEVALDFLNPGQASPVEMKQIDVFVRNTGSQIPADKMNKIFEPFFSTKDSSHFGVGLTTAGVLAAQMKMRLGIHSENNTTTAWLSIPLA